MLRTGGREPRDRRQAGGWGRAPGPDAQADALPAQLHQVLVQLQAGEKEQDLAAAPIQVSISVQLWRLPGCHEFLAALGRPTSAKGLLSFHLFLICSSPSFCWVKLVDS